MSTKGLCRGERVKGAGEAEFGGRVCRVILFLAGVTPYKKGIRTQKRFELADKRRKVTAG